MYNILIVGYGNIGKRYHQAIDKIKLKINVFIKEKKTIKKNKEIEKKFQNKFFDLVIISTTADTRLSEIKKIKKKFRVNSWIIEKNLGQSDQQIMEIEKIFKNNNNVWMSTPYKTMKCYKNLKKELMNKPGLEVTITGSDWGIVCNGTHFMDLFSWIFNERVKKIDNTKLEKKWILSKRKNFYEALGSLNIIYDTCKLTLISKKINKSEMFQDIVYNIEHRGKKSQYFHEEGIYINGAKKKFFGKMDYISHNMTSHIKNILLNKNCDLFKLKDTVKFHKIYILSFLKHWKKYGFKKNSKILPIT